MTVPVGCSNQIIEAYRAMAVQGRYRPCFSLGCPDFTNRKAMIFAIEAAHLCCAGFGSRPFARRLLELALRELS